jgi:hypothetical protein
MVTASRVQLWMACLGSSVLPNVGRLHSASDRGTVIHRYLEDVARYGQAAALGNVPEEHRAECKRIDVTKVVEYAEDKAEPEQAFAWSPSLDRGRTLASTGRAYDDVGEDEIAGTADLVRALDGDSLGVVIDYKTGRHDVEEPSRNWQLRTLALAVGRARNLGEVRAEIWKLRDDGGWWVRSHTFDSFDLDATAAEIRQRLEQANAVKTGARKLQLVEGDHCEWCPSLTSCPAKTTLARSLVTVTKTMDNMDALSLEERGLAWDVIARVQQVIDKARRSLEELAQYEPIPLPDGRTLSLQEDSREYVVGEVVREVVAERYGADVAAKVCEVKVSSSKAALDRELGKAAKEVKEEIRRRGGVRVVRSTRLKAV